jgi:starch-binding outer membrane protein, SusD/RagB family
MKNKIISFILILLIGMGLINCNKDFLDVEPMAVTNEGSFYLTKTDADQAVTAIYGQLAAQTPWDRFILADMGSIASDDAQGGGKFPNEVDFMEYLDRFTFTPTLSNVFDYTYGCLYKAIFLANIAITKLPNIVKTDSTATQQYIDTKVAEAKFLRALNYFYLIQIFGEVPYVDHILIDKEFNMGRSPMKKTFELIEQDLNDAKAILPARWSSDQIGRATKGAAAGVLAKVYLFESSYARNYPGDIYSLPNKGESRFKDLSTNWQLALDNAEEIINSGTYELVGTDGSQNYSSWRGLSNGFRFIWTSNGDNSKESVFEVQNIYDGLGYIESRGSSMINWTAARWCYDPITGGKIETGYWGFNCPTDDLVAEFNKEQRQPTDPFYGSLVPADPRFNVTIHKDTIGGNDSIQTVKGWCKVSPTGATSTEYNPTKMAQAKYETSYEEFKKIQKNWNNAPINNRILRYADVVLVAAEAAIMLGNTSKAVTYLNMVRTRARMCGPAGNTVPRDLAVGDLTNSEYSGFPVGFDQLIHDRRLELAMEGHRFFDLVRWNLAKQKLNGLVLTNLTTPTSGTYAIIFEQPKNDFFPLPDAQIQQTQGALEQYLGW